MKEWMNENRIHWDFDPLGFLGTAKALQVLRDAGFEATEEDMKQAVEEFISDLEWELA